WEEEGGCYKVEKDKNRGRGGLKKRELSPLSTIATALSAAAAASNFSSAAYFRLSQIRFFCLTL
ncbi:hypothetical protein TorRG33x02_063230, partial [Trema orientale]